MNDYIDKNSKIPYYIQLKDIINRKIDNNEFANKKLWSENEFSKKYEINFLTVRKALSELRSEGKIVTIKGFGTLIEEPKLEFDITKYLSFGKSLKDKGLIEEIYVKKKKVIEYDKDLFKRFDIKNFSSKIIYLERLRIINNDPVVYEKIFLNYDLCNTILNEECDMPLYDFIINNLKINLKSIEEYVEPKILNTEESKILNTVKGKVAFFVTRISYDNQGQWLELRKTVLRGDKCKYYLKIK